jgi:hypothetical protein
LPPLAARRSSNGRATSAAGTLTAAIVRRDTTVSVYAYVAEREPSLTWTVNEKSPVAVGVPESKPFEPSCKPVGSAPDLSDHVCVPPPAAVNWKLYGAFRTVAFGLSRESC